MSRQRLQRRAGIRQPSDGRIRRPKPASAGLRPRVPSSRRRSPRRPRLCRGGPGSLTDPAGATPSSVGSGGDPDTGCRPDVGGVHSRSVRVAAAAVGLPAARPADRASRRRRVQPGPARTSLSSASLSRRVPVQRDPSSARPAVRRRPASRPRPTSAVQLGPVRLGAVSSAPSTTPPSNADGQPVPLRPSIGEPPESAPASTGRRTGRRPDPGMSTARRRPPAAADAQRGTEAWPAGTNPRGRRPAAAGTVED